MKYKGLMTWCAVLLITISVIAEEVQAQSINYKAQLPENIHSVKEALQDVVKLLSDNKAVYFQLAERPTYGLTIGAEKKWLINNVSAVEGGLVITTKTNTFELKVSEIVNTDIYENKVGKKEKLFDLCVFFGLKKEWISFNSFDKEILCHLADDIYYLKVQTAADKTKGFTDELARFTSVAAKNKELAFKPLQTEDQRRYIVQANAAVQTKQNDRAIVYFNQALQFNELSFPDAYYNLALIFAQKNQFERAILNMKKYLLLSSDSPDARAAQDKVYEWEAGIKK